MKRSSTVLSRLSILFICLSIPALALPELIPTLEPSPLRNSLNFTANKNAQHDHPNEEVRPEEPTAYTPDGTTVSILVSDSRTLIRVTSAALAFTSDLESAPTEVTALASIINSTSSTTVDDKVEASRPDSFKNSNETVSGSDTQTTSTGDSETKAGDDGEADAPRGRTRGSINAGEGTGPDETTASTADVSDEDRTREPAIAPDPSWETVGVVDERFPPCPNTTKMIIPLRIICHFYITSEYDPAVGIVITDSTNRTRTQTVRGRDGTVDIKPSFTYPPPGPELDLDNEWEPDDADEYLSLSPEEHESKCSRLFEMESSTDLESHRFCHTPLTETTTMTTKNTTSSTTTCPASCYYTVTEFDGFVTSRRHKYPSEECQTKCIIAAPDGDPWKTALPTSYVNYKVRATRWVARRDDNRISDVDADGKDERPGHVLPQPGNTITDETPIRTSNPEPPKIEKPVETRTGERKVPTPIVTDGREPSSTTDDAVGIISSIWQSTPISTPGQDDDSKGDDTRKGRAPQPPRQDPTRRVQDPEENGKDGNVNSLDTGKDIDDSNKDDDRWSWIEEPNIRTTQLGGGIRSPQRNPPKPGGRNGVNDIPRDDVRQPDDNASSPPRITKPTIIDPRPPKAIQSIIVDMFGGDTRPSPAEIVNRIRDLPVDSQVKLGDWVQRQMQEGIRKNAPGVPSGDKAKDGVERIPSSTKVEVYKWLVQVVKDTKMGNSKTIQSPSPDLLSKIDELPPSLKIPLKEWMKKNAESSKPAKDDSGQAHQPIITPKILDIIYRLDPDAENDPDLTAIALDVLLHDPGYTKRLRQAIDESERKKTSSSSKTSSKPTRRLGKTTEVSSTRKPTQSTAVIEEAKTTTTKKKNGADGAYESLGNTGAWVVLAVGHVFLLL